MTKSIYKIPPLYFPKKRSDYNQRKYQKKEANKDECGINGKNQLCKTINKLHIELAKVKRL
jgi:hypothetical protein